jgi:hypothetical protein
MESPDPNTTWHEDTQERESLEVLTEAAEWAARWPPWADAETSNAEPPRQPPVAGLLEHSAALLTGIVRADLMGVAQATGDGAVGRRKIVGLSATSGSPGPVVHEGSLADRDSLAAYALNGDGTPVISRLDREGRFADVVLFELGVVWVLCAPLHVARRPLGTLELYRTDDEAFSPDDAGAAEAILLRLVSLLEEARHLRAARAEPGEGNRAAASGGDQPTGDLRSSPRRQFPFTQLIAPARGSREPSRDEFVAVPCRDLSEGGISLYLSEPPEFDYLLVALGPSPTLNVRARVVRVKEIERAGQTLYLVGCQFIDRVSL